MNSKLYVCIYNAWVGVLLLDRNQQMTFSYQKDAKRALSLSMPLKEKNFDEKNCRNFFRGYLPEDRNKLEAMSAAVGCHPKQTFALLQSYGRECNGAISFCSINELKEEPQDPLIIAHPIKKSKLDFKESDSFGLFSGKGSKIPVCLIDEQIALPDPKSPSTHFLKLGTASKIINEYFCLCVAKVLGIDCVTAKLYSLVNGPGLLVERYDRKIINFHHVQYAHQEDFLQALGYFPSHQYEWDKGPSLKECFALLQKTLIPAVSRLQLVKRVMFNYLIGNSQAHAKNMSLLYCHTTKPVLAPFYSPTATSDHSVTMAMKIGESEISEKVSLNDWRLFCQRIGFSFPIFKQMLYEYSTTIVEQAYVQQALLIEQKWDNKELDNIIKALTARAEKIKILLRS
ncbi:MAG: HipA domain-containing protein [Candidatus Berkiella sp.]